MTRRHSAIVIAAAGLAAASSPATAQDNVWVGAGAGLWVEFNFPLSLFFDDIHYLPLPISYHFRSRTLCDITDWVYDNLGIQIELHIEASAGIEIPGVGEVSVGKAGAWLNGTPPIQGAGPPGLIDINADGFLDIPLWEIPGDEDAMIVSSYMLDAGLVEFMKVEPAPRIDPDDPHPSVFIPMPPNPDYTFTPIATIPITLLNAIVAPVPGEEFFSIPPGALAPGSPGLTEVIGLTLTPAAGCNHADLAEPYGTLDFSDVVAYLVEFGGMSLDADLAEPFGSLDFSDVVEFLVAFGAGCP